MVSLDLINYVFIVQTKLVDMYNYNYTSRFTIAHAPHSLNIYFNSVLQLEGHLGINY